MSTRLELALLSLILALAALLRFLWLDAVPAGWHHDEALMGIMASEVYRGVQRPIFFAQYLGQEPLYLYLSAGMMWLLGGDQGILPLRLTSAIVGVATVGVTYLLGRELFGRRVGLIGAALLSFSLWQVLLSRDGYRVITQPLLEGLTVLLLWKAGQRQSIGLYAAAGVALGATLYTYLAARAFPAALLLFGIWWLATGGRPSARMARGIVVFFVAAAIVATPLLVFFATHPGTFTARIDQVSVFQAGAPALVVAKNVAKLLAKFTIYGDTLWRYNVAGRPIFVGLVGMLFYLGLFVALRNTWRRHAASALVLAWFVVMLFPSFLSLDDGTYFSRASGLAPAVFLLPAIGFVSLWDWALSRAALPRRRMLQGAFAVAIAAVLLLEAGMTCRDYFVIWADSAGAAKETMADMVVAARVLNREARPIEEDILISSSYHQHATIAHLAPTVYPHVRWFDGNATLVLPTMAARHTLLLFPSSALPNNLDALMPPQALVERATFTDGTTAMVAYRLTPDQVRATADRILGDPSLTRLTKNLGDEIELVGYQLEPQAKHNTLFTTTVVWHVLKDAPQHDYVMFAHLLNDKGGLYRQVDSTDFRSSEWRAGDVVVARYTMEIKDWVPTGRYSLVVGVYDRATMQRLPIKGDTLADVVLLGSVDVVGQD